MKKLIVITLLAAATALWAKSAEENIADLKSADDAVAIKAAQELGADGAKAAIEPLGDVVKSNRSTGVRIAATSALGRIAEKGRTTTILKESIEADQDNQVVYTSLLALMNIADVTNPDLVKAIEFCETNKKSDPFISDIVERLRKKFPNDAAKAEKKPAEEKPAEQPAEKPAE
ncbi:MAG TPA: HEAT repeat domain-containing protein [Turneriella sp.]|nr:HEAT repeat domain-containing protein [Turneriella sp.]